MVVQILFSAAVLLAVAAVCFISVKMKALTLMGAVFAFILSAALFAIGGLFFLGALLTFFLSSTLVGKLKSPDKDKIEANLHTKTSRRDAVQVAANGGAALLMAVPLLFVKSEAVIIAVCSALAACNADTWASELGMLSRRQPRSITTFRPVQKGLSGGVTLLGFAASVAGAALIAGVYGVFSFARMPFISVLVNAILVGAAGVSGAVLDSILGDTLQVKYKSADTGMLTEKPCIENRKNNRVKGFAFMTNDMVNFTSSWLAALLSLAIGHFI